MPFAKHQRMSTIKTKFTSIYLMSISGISFFFNDVHTNQTFLFSFCRSNSERSPKYDEEMTIIIKSEKKTI